MMFSLDTSDVYPVSGGPTVVCAYHLPVPTPIFSYPYSEPAVLRTLLITGHRSLRAHANVPTPQISVGTLTQVNPQAKLALHGPNRTLFRR